MKQKYEVLTANYMHLLTDSGYMICFSEIVPYVVDDDASDAPHYIGKQRVK